jgi:hypothetical protein
MLTISLEWFPCLKDSRFTSLHQKEEMIIIIKMVVKNKNIIFIFNIRIVAVTIDRAPKEARRGQGLMSTI